MSVSVVIVNYRTAELSIAAARSVLNEPEVEQVVIVDNASGSDVETLKEAFEGDDKVLIVPSTENRGFGAGNNLGVEHATGDLMFLLNSDAMLRTGGMAALVESLNAHPEVGIVAPKIFIADGSTLQTDAYGIFPTGSRTLRRETKSPEETLTPEWVTGCAMLMRKADFEAVGGFDDHLFMYFEDVLLCWQLQQRGKSSLRVLESEVVHLGGASSKSTMRKKQMYYAAQDFYLQTTGESAMMRAAIKALRWPNLMIGRLLGRS